MNLSLSNLKTLLSQQQTFVIEFYATWCGPCKVYGPKLKELCSTLKIQLYTINGDEISQSHELYSFMTNQNISAYPTTLIYAKGKLVQTIVGADIAKVKAVLSSI